jgi:Zn-dependent protease with chaperone function
MDFFRSQDVARQKSGWLFFYFLIAVVGVVGFVSFVCVIALRFAADTGTGMEPQIVIGAGLATLAIIALGTAYKTAQLAGGGRVVAESLGGRLVNTSTMDPLERRLLNVVDEMAIASGVPAPPVYIMDDEREINAFAAGYAPGDAVVGVTRGTLEQLPRDELQGVIAHEFSHILNGDMRLGIRLIGLIHGILIIALTGTFLLRIIGHTSHRSSSSSDKKGGGNIGLALLVLGVGLYIIGWIGVVFGRLIKAAHSRQREYLADSSAVQFTRNPLGIAGALKRIGGYGGSKLQAANAEVASHMYFGDGMGFFAASPFSTHPPLPDRILRLDPAFKGEMNDHVPDVPPGVIEANEQHHYVPLAPKLQRSVPTEDAVSTIGDPQREHVAYADSLLDGFAPILNEAAHEPFSARALVAALLFAEGHKERAEGFDDWKSKAEAKLVAETERLLPATLQLPEAQRLPMLELCFPALQQMSQSQRQAFRKDMDRIVTADKRVTLFEYTVQRTLLRRLLDEPKPIRSSVDRFSFVTGSLSHLLGALAYQGDSTSAEFAFDVGVVRLGIELELPPQNECGLAAVDEALVVLHGLAPKLKRKLLDACAATVGADGKITIREAELFRAIADSLDCPVPPLVAG